MTSKKGALRGRLRGLPANARASIDVYGRDRRGMWTLVDVLELVPGHTEYRVLGLLQARHLLEVSVEVEGEPWILMPREPVVVEISHLDVVRDIDLVPACRAPTDAPLTPLTRFPDH